MNTLPSQSKTDKNKTAKIEAATDRRATYTFNAFISLSEIGFKSTLR
jgi:hypothetical protein